MPVAEQPEPVVEKEIIAVSPAEGDPAASYSRFAYSQRLIIFFVASITGLLSPLSSSVYVPAIPEISKDLNVSVSAINYTITSYLLFQAVTPIIWASIGDSLGRRRLYLMILSIYVGSCIGLKLSNNYTAVLILRALQSTGSASTSALGAGMISDLIHVSKRGGFMGTYSALAGFGTAFGPVIGGIMAQYTGWHNIFLFLLALSATMLLIILLFIPETHRSHVEDGSVLLPRYLRPPLPFLEPSGMRKDHPLQKPKFKIDIIGPFLIMKELDVMCCILYPGICYTVWQMSIVAASTIYARDYGLSELHIGLTYIANGIGSLCGSLLVGKMLDIDYQKQLRRESEGVKAPPKEVRKIEHARIRAVRIPIIIFIATTIAFGWTVRYHVHIAAPITLSFFVGGFDTCILAAFSTLVVDLFEKKSFGATASMNLARCLLATAGTSAIEPMIQAVGTGWAFTILGLICLVTSPLVLAEYRFGTEWRDKRKAKLQARQERS
ncbi:hypothetical protein N7478_006896 [Penicillium angulare]|uniref:uncharacterized protein n=1 Tax=Penicillium angulare TaxID=116970 RepID=UPI0025414694|nr:uncharacterized protein N7478_006896 [Penicillium angulare]KAJ5281524.1 hypothetical protein N7478_006896 [Penicillium angulare]